MTDHKATIETMVNTSAIALSSYGVIEITNGRYLGTLALLIGIGLEYFKYRGRKKKLW